VGKARWSIRRPHLGFGDRRAERARGPAPYVEQVLEHFPNDRERVEQYWLAAWARAVPGSDPGRAWELLRPLAALRDALVYQVFVDNIEPSERVYHRDDVPSALERASSLARRA
jgi:hypothetical protein